jgi:probable HAF family extracellular repeat protein
MKFNKLSLCLGLLFAASTCFAQIYTVTDLVTPTTKVCLDGFAATGINASGQVVGYCGFQHFPYWAFRTAASGPITDDIGTSVLPLASTPSAK